MRPDTTPQSGSTPSDSAIEVELRPPHAPEFVAIVALRGEHDIATAPDVQVVLTPLKGDLLIDLTSCDFVDSSLISVLVGTHLNLQRDGHRLELLVGLDTAVARTLEISGVSRVIAVRRSISDSGADTRPVEQ
jgi:anti-anti-sigma factor